MGFTKERFSDSLEYQRLLLADFAGDHLFARVFVITGDAWFGEFMPKTQPKVSFGRLKYYRGIQNPTAISVNLAYGIGEEAALTVGFEGRVAIDYADIFNNWKNQ